MTSDRKILFVANTSTLGGASLSLLTQLECLKAAAYTAVVVVPEPGPLTSRLDQLGMVWRVVEQPWWTACGSEDSWLYSMRNLPVAVAQLRRLIRDEGVGLVWTNTSVTPAAALAAASEDRPHVWYAREFLGRAGLTGPLAPDVMRKCMLALSHRVATNSSALAAEFEKGAAADQVRMLHDQLDCSPFLSCTPQHSSRVIISIGTTNQHKGIEELVSAAIRLGEWGIAFRVIVAGDFDFLSDKLAAQRRLASVGLEDRVEFRPYQPEVTSILNGAAVYCCPSRAEGLSRVIVEAMAAGLPVVSTDCGGPRDLVVDGTTGRLVPVQDSESLAAALRDLLEQTAMAEAMGQAGRKRAVKMFDPERLNSQFLAFVEEGFRGGSASVALPLVEWITTYSMLAGPRTLLGKKWRLMKPLMS